MPHQSALTGTVPKPPAPAAGTPGPSGTPVLDPEKTWVPPSSEESLSDPCYLRATPPRPNFTPTPPHQMARMSAPLTWDDM